MDNTWQEAGIIPIQCPSHSEADQRQKNTRMWVPCSFQPGAALSGPECTDDSCYTPHSRRLTVHSSYRWICFLAMQAEQVLSLRREWSAEEAVEGQDHFAAYRPNSICAEIQRFHAPPRSVVSRAKTNWLRITYSLVELGRIFRRQHDVLEKSLTYCTA